MQIRRLLNFLGVVVLAGLAVHLAGSEITQHYTGVTHVAVEVAAGAFIATILYVLIALAVTYVTNGRYAVEALILNDRSELLMYRHPHHKCMLPPGGRVRRTEFPHDAIHRRLAERIGLATSQYTFDPRFHHGLTSNTGNLGEVQRVAAPYVVQRELHKQRSFIRFHYDFIYVIQLTDPNPDFDKARCAPVHFVDMHNLEEMVTQRRTLPDVLDLYSRVIDHITAHVPR